MSGYIVRCVVCAVLAAFMAGFIVGFLVFSEDAYLLTGRRKQVKKHKPAKVAKIAPDTGSNRKRKNLSFYKVGE